MLRFAEELLLLALDDESGALAAIPEPIMGIALAGATLMDLALEHRIDTDRTRLILTDPAPLDDDLLDPALAEIAAAAADDNTTHSADYWIIRIARSAPDLKERALSRLVKRGILADADDGVIALSDAVSRPRRYPMTDGEAKQEIRLRIMGILFSDDIPSPQDAAIIGLADAGGIFNYILTRAELEQVEPRIHQVEKLDLIGQAVARLAAQPPPDVAPATAAPAAGGWPVVSGPPIIGSALNMMANPQDFILRQYRRLGPIFEVQTFNRRIVIMAGPEANQFLQRSGKVHFRSREHWRGFNTEIGTSQHLLSMDGTEHTRYRRALRRAYSRSHLERRLPAALDIARREIAGWTPDAPVPALRALKRISIEQIAVITANTSALDYLDDLEIYVKSLLHARLARSRPGLLMRMPPVRRARRRLDALYATILSNHQTPPGAVGYGVPGPAREPDIIDDILEMHRADPQLMPETDLWAACMGPFLAGNDTVSNILTFMLYALLRAPELQEQVRAEADAFFAAGPPTAPGLRQMDVTHRAAMETLRLYPMVFPMRIAANSFDFAGYRVPAGARLMIAAGISHFLPELYPDPQRFDIERYTPGRMEHTPPGAFAPFGLGTHTCLANGFAQAQIMLTMAAIFHAVELTPAPPAYRMKTRFDPMLCPDRRFAFRVTRRRPVNA